MNNISHIINRQKIYRTLIERLIEKPCVFNFDTRRIRIGIEKNLVGCSFFKETKRADHKKLIIQKERFYNSKKLIREYYKSYKKFSKEHENFYMK